MQITFLHQKSAKAKAENYQDQDHYNILHKFQTGQNHQTSFDLSPFLTFYKYYNIIFLFFQIRELLSAKCPFSGL